VARAVVDRAAEAGSSAQAGLESLSRQARAESS
jgi:hypothetical protein